LIMGQHKAALNLSRIGIALLLLIGAPGLSAQTGETASGTESTASGIIRVDPPEQDFYSKKIDCLGVWIKAPEVVADEALLEAHRRIAVLIGRNEGIRYNLTEVGSELHIIGKDQGTSDLPENRHWKGRPYDGNLTIDERTRGIGGRVASCGEENLLKLDKDRYRGRDICSHEFAHTILNYATDAATRERVVEQFKTSTGEGKWSRTYGGSNFNEYFSELTMWYVGTRGHWTRDAGPEPGIGPDWLKSYDPGGYELVDSIYSGHQPVEMIVRKVLSAIAPEQEGTIRSPENPRNRAARITILYENQSGREVSLFSLDQEGKRRRPRTIAAGGKNVVRAFPGQAWLVADGNGKALGIYIAEETPGRATLR
jgi:alpha-glucosidase